MCWGPGEWYWIISSLAGRKQPIQGTCEWFGGIGSRRKDIITGCQKSEIGHLWLVGLAGHSESHCQVDKGLKKNKFLVIAGRALFSFRPAALNWGRFHPPGYVWQCLEIVLVATTQ